MNFMFQWQKQQVTSEQSERVRHKIHIFSPKCNVLFIIWETNPTKAKGRNRDVIERYNTHKRDIQQIRHSGPR